MATIRRRNGKYQVQVRINGYTRSKTFPSHDLAKKWANKQELIAFTEPDDRPRYVPVNFSEILAKYWDYARHHHKGALVEKIVIKALEAPTELFMQEIITWWRTSDGFKKIQVTKRFSANSETTSIITQPFRLN